MQPSALQQQFPLSGKKLVKKIIGKIIVLCLLALLLTIILIGPILAFSNSPTLNRHSPIVIILSNGPVIFVVAAFIYLILYVFYMHAYIKRYYYSADQNFLTIKKGVLTPSEINIQYQKIQDVYVDQDILDRLLGLYDVHLATTTIASSMAAHIDGVNKTTADGLKQFLLQKVSK